MYDILIYGNTFFSPAVSSSMHPWEKSLVA